MARFWGGNSEQNRPAPERASEDDDGDRVLNEQTRLLPNRLNSDRPFLNPDDPAVSPYNLWSVRVTRWATMLLAILGFLWWLLQLVSIFVTPPKTHMRGSGFFSFGYASLALATLLFTITFFGAPSKAVRILSVFMAAMLLIDAVILLAVEKTRYEEGWVGVTSVVWALVVSLWTLFCDRTVKRGKAEEEERLTGRVENRRTLTEWTEVLISTAGMIIFSVAIVLITATLILRALDAGLAPPGTLYWVDGDKYRIHVFCQGKGTDAQGAKLPTVFFEGGETHVENGLWQFAENAVKNGSIARYCWADRPGFAWSDTAPSPLSVGMAADALSEALARADEHGPWVLVSAGVGSLYSRVFSSRHGREISGLLLIDPLHEDLLYRLSSPGRGFLLWLRGIISPLGLDRLPGALFRGRNKVDRTWGCAAKQSGKYISAKLQESLVADSLSKRDVISAKQIQYHDTPLTIISSGEQIRKDGEWEEKQRDLTHLTRNLQHWDVVEKAPHQVWQSYAGREMIEKRLAQLVQGK